MTYVDVIIFVLFLQNDFTSEDFVSMPAPLLYKMFKAKTDYPLHTAIRAKREDVVFLYLIEYDSQVCKVKVLYSLKFHVLTCSPPMYLYAWSAG